MLPNDMRRIVDKYRMKEGTHRLISDSAGMLLGQLTILLHLKHDFLRI
jgi:hypothetical protein